MFLKPLYSNILLKGIWKVIETKSFINITCKFFYYLIRLNFYVLTEQVPTDKLARLLLVDQFLE